VLLEVLLKSGRRKLLSFEEAPPDLLGRRVLFRDEKGRGRVGVAVGLKEGKEAGGKVLSFPDPYPLLRPYQLEALKALSRYYLFPTGRLLWDFLPSSFGEEEKEFVLPGERRGGLLDPTSEEIRSFVEKRRKVPYESLTRRFGSEAVRFLLSRGFLKKVREWKAEEGWRFFKASEGCSLRSERKKALLRLLKERGALSLTELKEAGFSASLVKELLRRGCLEEVPPPPPFEGRPLKAERTLRCLSFEEAVEELADSSREALREGKSVLAVFTNLSELRRAEASLREKGIEVFSLTGAKLARWWFAPYRKPALFLSSFKGLFLPLPQGSLYFLFNELESTKYPKNEVDARRVLYALSQEGGSSLHLFTPFPRLETYYAVKRGLFKASCLEPSVEVRVAKRKGEVITEELYRFLKERAEKRTLFVVSKTGYSYLYCPRCDALAECPLCGRFLTYSKEREETYCSKSKSHFRTKGKVCPSCGGEAQETGFGLERAKEAVEELFGKRENFFFATKPSWPERYETVVLLSGDAVLSVPSYESKARFLESVAYARAAAEESFFLQTSYEEEELLRELSEGKLFPLYERELEERRRAGLPPFYRVALITSKRDPSSLVEERTGIKPVCVKEGEVYRCLVRFRGKEVLGKLRSLAKERGIEVKTL